MERTLMGLILEDVKKDLPINNVQAEKCGVVPVITKRTKRDIHEFQTQIKEEFTKVKELEGIETSIVFLLETFMRTYSVDLLNYSKSIRIIEEDIINNVLYEIQEEGKDFNKNYLAKQKQTYDNYVNDSESEVAFLNARDKDLTVKKRKVNFYSEDKGIVDKEIKYRHNTRGIGALIIPNGFKNPKVNEIFCISKERKILTHEANILNIDLILNTNVMYSTVLESLTHKVRNDYYAGLCDDIIQIYKLIGQKNLKVIKEGEYEKLLARQDLLREQLNKLVSKNEMEKWIVKIKIYDQNITKICKSNKHIYSTPAFLRKLAFRPLKKDLQILSITRKKELLQAFFRDLENLSGTFRKHLVDRNKISSKDKKKAAQRKKRDRLKEQSPKEKVIQWRKKYSLNTNKKQCASETGVSIGTVYNNWEKK